MNAKLRYYYFWKSLFFIFLNDKLAKKQGGDINCMITKLNGIKIHCLKISAVAKPSLDLLGAVLMLVVVLAAKDPDLSDKTLEFVNNIQVIKRPIHQQQYR